MDRIAIVGVGQTNYERKKDDTFEELVFEAATKALSDAGGEIKDIDNIVTVSNDFWDGRTISSMAIQDAAGSWGKDISTVEGDGTFGVMYGMMRILSGSFDTTLVVSHMKGSEGVMNLITNAMFDPIYQRGLGIDATSSAALQARCYMQMSGATEEDFARVSVKNHKNAMNNPVAQLPMDISIKDVLSSKKVAEPLKLLDCSPISDGAAAVVLANEKGLKRFKKDPVWIRGAGQLRRLLHAGLQGPRPPAGAQGGSGERLQDGGHKECDEGNRRGRGVRRLLLHGAHVVRGARPGKGMERGGPDQIRGHRDGRRPSRESIGGRALGAPGAGGGPGAHHRGGAAGARRGGKTAGKRRQDSTRPRRSTVRAARPTACSSSAQ